MHPLSLLILAMSVMMRGAGAVCRRGLRLQNLAGRRSVTSSTFKLFDAVPRTPASFNSTDFRIEPYLGPLPLERINSHALDTRIRFEEGPHKYFWDENPIDRSVTQVVEQFFEGFEPNQVIEKMKKGSRWPRAEYMTKSGQVWTDDQIRTSWDLIGENARNRGTWMHHNIERFINGLPSVPTGELPEMRMFEDFFREVIQDPSGLIQPYRTEWRICAPDLSLAGSVDFVGKTASTNEYVIIDWKRSKKLPTSLQNTFNRRAKPPLSHIDDCDANKYFLQLNVYKYILEKYYSIPISRMIVASFHPTCDGYFMAEAPMWQGEVERILKSPTDSKNPALKGPSSSTPLPPPVSKMTQRPQF